MTLSKFGQILCQSSPIVALMEDLGDALNNNPDMLFLGGGNPAQVPEAQAIFRTQLATMLASETDINSLLGVYQSPKGNEKLLESMATYLQQQCGWPVTQANLAVISGSQSAFFILLNLFAGEMGSGDCRTVALPLVPEYLGYQSQGLSANHFDAHKPTLELIQEHRFKYSIDFSTLTLSDRVGAVCVSRPTNPSGNVISDIEMTQLQELCVQRDIPLIVDLAYGEPFPGVVYGQTKSIWQSGMIAVLSLSKLGLPGVRSAVVVADPDVIGSVVKANTIINLANGNLGPALMDQLIRSGELQRLSQRILPDFYRQQRDYMIEVMAFFLHPFPYRLHQAEGAFFIWLWLDQLPITSETLYQRLKQKGVLVMAGEPFFFGLQQHWAHGRQCLRLTYCQSKDVIHRAISILAAELKIAYGE